MPKQKSRKKITIPATEGSSNVALQGPGNKSGQGRPPVNQYTGVICLFLIIANLIVFGQVLGHEFIYLDDNTYVFENQLVQAGFTGESLRVAFTTFLMGHWHPITWLSYMLDYKIFGLHPAGFHFTNLLLHIANTLLLFLFLRYMTAATWRSAAVAVLFAFHPLHVEPVVWVSSRKDLLSTFFGLLSLWAYLYYTKDTSSWRRYFLVIIFFLLSLMSKAMLVTLPLIMLLLDYWPLGRFRTDLPKESIRSRALYLIREKAPLILLSVVFIIIAIVAVGNQKTVVAQDTGDVKDLIALPRAVLRFLYIPYGYGYYIIKMFWPRDLAVLYPPNRHFSQLFAAGAGLFLIFTTILSIRKANKYPYLFLGWFWFLITFVPVIRLFLADRYTYITLIGLFIVLVWGAAEAADRWLKSRIALQVAAGLLILALGVGSWFQARLWRDSITLFEHTLSVTKRNVLIHYNLGFVFFTKGKFDEAERLFTEAIKLRPDYAEAHSSLGNVYLRQKKLEEAGKKFAEAVRFKPELVEAQYNLGYVLLQQKKPDEAIEYLQEAIRLKPDYAKAHNGLGQLFVQQMRLDEAVAQFEEAIRLEPKYREAHQNLAQVLFLQGNIEKARSHYSKAARLKSDDF
jgi:protein O-mannosyl-transferase